MGRAAPEEPRLEEVSRVASDQGLVAVHKSGQGGGCVGYCGCFCVGDSVNENCLVARLPRSCVRPRKEKTRWKRLE